MSQQSKFLFNKKIYCSFDCYININISISSNVWGGTDGTEFKSEIFSKRRIVVAPILIIIAFIMCGYSIMMKK